jgi:glycosyltransferase involved in cell wall biosynthesis
MFSIVTPSLGQPLWLRRCIRSVADQQTPHEHLIQDAGTGPELDRWVRDHTSAKLTVEPDAGMFDGLNRGFGRATGDLLAYLNCDEQYLPGALARVAAAFDRDPELDLVAGDYLIVDASGTLLSFHRATPLRRSMILTDHLYDYTCALFFRRHLWDLTGPFSLEFPLLADAEWVARALTREPRINYLHQYTSVFTITGENMNLRPAAWEEERRLRALAPPWARAAAPLLRELRHVEKLLRGGYFSRQLNYSIYTEDFEQRVTFSARRPSPRHPWARAGRGRKT